MADDWTAVVQDGIGALGEPGSMEELVDRSAVNNWLVFGSKVELETLREALDLAGRLRAL